MLKHLTSRSETANSHRDSLSDLEKSPTAATFTSYESSISFGRESTYPSEQGFDNYAFVKAIDNDQVGDGLKINLTKPTIKRILERDKLRRGYNSSSEREDETKEIKNENIKEKSGSMRQLEEFSSFCRDLKDNTRTSEKSHNKFCDECCNTENFICHHENRNNRKRGGSHKRKDYLFYQNTPPHSLALNANHFPVKSYELRGNNEKISSSKYKKQMSVDKRFTSEFLEPGIRCGQESTPTKSINSDISIGPYDRYNTCSSTSILDKNDFILQNEHASHTIPKANVNKFVSPLSPPNQFHDDHEKDDTLRINTHTNQNLNYDIDRYQEILKRGRHLCEYLSIFFTFVIAVACILAGILHYYVGYYPEVVYMNQGDVRLLPISSLFCQSIKSKSKSSKLRLLAFKQKSSPILHENTMTEKLNIYPSGIWKRDFYLLKGSSIKLKIRSMFSVDVLVFAGEKRYSIWFARQLSKTYSLKITCCAGTKEKEKNIVINAVVDERYFIVMQNKVEVIPVEIAAEMTFARVMFDFTDTTSSCLSEVGKECILKPSFDIKVSCAAEVPISKNVKRISQSSLIEWECDPRVWFFVVVYLLVFLASSAIILAAYYITVTHCMPAKRWQFSKYEKNSNRFMRYDDKNHDAMERLENTFDLKNNYKEQVYPKSTVIINKTNNQDMEMKGDVEFDSQPSPYLCNRKVSLKPELGVSLDHLDQIYPRTRFCSDTVDSGISIDYRYLKGNNNPDLLQLQESQMQNLKAHPNHRFQQLEIEDGPRVHQLLQFPKSNPSCCESNESLHKAKQYQNYEFIDHEQRRWRHENEDSKVIYDTEKRNRKEKDSILNRYLVNSLENSNNEESTSQEMHI